MMRKFDKYKTSFKEWIVFTLTFFFLYDIIWAFADFVNFKKSFEGYYICLFIDFVYCGIFSLASLMVNQVLLKRKFFKLAETDQKRFLSSAAIIVTVNIFIAAVFDFLLDFILPDFAEEDVWGTLFLFGIIASLLTLIHMLLYYSKVIVDKNNENIRLQKKYLRLQLNPHFVFNNLSSLAGMIVIEPKKAEEYVVGLSQVYRYMLQHIEQEYITIEEAMNFAVKYVDLLNLRYDGNIVLEWHGGKSENAYILALSLQLLIENAIKHNAPNDNNTLHIQTSVYGGMLVIKNNRIYTRERNDQTVDSYGIGLKNLKQRYELESGKKIEYNITNDSFEIGLPLIKKGARI